VSFWSFVVALMVLLLGGMASVYQGVRHILTPDPIVAPGLNFAVLALAAVFEGLSFATGYREFKRMVRGRGTRLWTFIRLSKDPSLYASLLEDSAALMGIAFAAAFKGLVGAAPDVGAAGAVRMTFGSTTMLEAFEKVGAPSFWLDASSRTCGPGLRVGGTNTTWPASSAIAESTTFPSIRKSIFALARPCPATTASPPGSTRTTSKSGPSSFAPLIAKVG